MKNKTYYFSIVLICLGLMGILGGCARPVELKPAITREFNFNGFSSIEAGLSSRDYIVFGNVINVPIGLEVVKADTYKVEITANENIFDFIHLSQSGKNLKVLIDRSKIGTENATLNVKIAMPELEGLKLSGGVMRADVFSSASNFEADVSGSSKLNIDMKTGTTLFKISSSSDVIASGATGEIRAEVSGSSSFTADLQSTKSTFIVSSSADMVSRGTSGALTAEVSGAGKLDLNLESGKASLKLSSSSDITGTLKASEMTVDASGASRIELKGSADSASFTGSSSSDIAMPQYVLNSAVVTLSGASDADIQVSQHLNVNLSSSSHLKYTGQPVMGDIKVSGASAITHN